MSHPFDSLPTRLRSALPSTSPAAEFDKPDAKASLDHGSPISPLRSRPSSFAATPSSSTSSSGSTTSSAKNNPVAAPSNAVRMSDAGVYNHLNSKNHSGELLTSAPPRPTHRRSGSGALFYSSGCSASSPDTNILPAGNIFPSGKMGKPSMAARPAVRSDVLGSGTANYGHGSIMRGGGGTTKNSSPEAANVAVVKRAFASLDPEEAKRLGNEMYRRGQFAEALRLYDRAITLCPENAAYRSNRAAALTGLRRLPEAIKECEEAVRLDPDYGRAHHRLASLHIRLGQVECARKHFLLAGPHPDSVELQKLQAMDNHINQCMDARRIGDWKSALRETEAAIACGADSSPLLSASKAEALLHLNQLDEADLALANACTLETSTCCNPVTRYFGIISSSYVYFIRAQVDMALGRFENAVAVAEKARLIDPGSAEVIRTLNRVKSAARARSRGNELFNAGNFEEACLAYGEGLKYDPYNPVLLCNRAACRSKLEQWEKSIEDCNEALRIKPNYIKALLRRAASSSKLERWTETVRDYELLQKELPTDTQVAEALFHAQVALKTSRGEEISNMKFGGEVEEITGLEQFQESISLPGVSVIQFTTTLNKQSVEITSFVDGLCARYPLVSFLKVDVNEIPAVAKSENIRMVPTFKIYKNGLRVKEIVCPSQQLLENWVRHYGV